jgi:ABC-2 type transport system permease protein
MATLHVPEPPALPLARAAWALRDGWTLTRREFSQLRHQPGELAATVILPGVLVVLFGYVFGSAIQVPGGGNYRAYLMPGLFAMSAITGVMAGALAVSKDIAEGVMDRFRSMPVARSAVPFGRTAADLATSVPGVLVMVGVGLVVGWRMNDGPLAALAGFGLILLLRYALSWIGTFIGLLVRPEVADNLVPLVFPVSMLSNSFVPTGGMPAWLRVIADWNPVSGLVAACRELFGNPTALGADPGFPLRHPIAVTLAWSVAILAVFVPLTTLRYRRAGR